jgi:hypothetical protein
LRDTDVQQRPVGCRVDHHRFQLLAEHAALGIDLVDRHQRGVLEHRLRDGHRPGETVQDADLDRVLALCECARAAQAEAEGDGGGEDFQVASTIHGDCSQVAVNDDRESGRKVLRKGCATSRRASHARSPARSRAREAHRRAASRAQSALGAHHDAAALMGGGGAARAARAQRGGM